MHTIGNKSKRDTEKNISEGKEEKPSINKSNLSGSSRKTQNHKELIIASTVIAIIIILFIILNLSN